MVSDREGGTYFFSGRGLRPGFLKCGACELIFASERRVLWIRIFKFGGLRAKIWAKIEALEAKISQFFLKEGLVNGFLSYLLEMVHLRTAGEAWKEGLQGLTSPHPLSRSVPLGCRIDCGKQGLKFCCLVVKCCRSSEKSQ